MTSTSRLSNTVMFPSMFSLLILLLLVPFGYPYYRKRESNDGVIHFSKVKNTEFHPSRQKVLRVPGAPGPVVDVDGISAEPEAQHDKRHSTTDLFAAANGTPKRRQVRATDANCQISGASIERIHNNKFHFNDSNYNLALLWTGSDGKELMALTTLEQGFFAAQSHLWLSLDYGVSFTNIDDRIEGAIIRRDNGIFKSPLDPQRVILISYMSDLDTFGSKMYISKDGGRTFKVIVLPFYPEGSLYFHPTNADWLFVRTPTNEMKIWLSTDFGYNWKVLKSQIEQAAWASVDMKADKTILLLQHQDSEEGLNLIETSDFGSSFTTLQKHVYNFGLQGKFIYAAIDYDKDASDLHVLHVSTDLGRTWNPTQLPVITSDRFFSVLDMSEGLIFMHVDDSGNTGTGTIYTSSADGIVFSKSLERHLFPNGGTITDFYRADSMRGVYLASQIHEDSTIHTMITFDRGGIWHTVTPPEGAACNDAGPCSLQIHNQYSRAKGIAVPSGPLTDSTATGLILAHATVADGLELRAPDVYVSSNGGYNWIQALVGPHHYAITNSGGLLVAISTAGGATDTVKFSYDEGHCWNSYNFSDEKITVTGLLPEPSKKSLNISIWGFGERQEWRSYMIDFGAILDRQCDDSDFVEWLPHEENGKQGCLLGLKETFRRVKKDSMCRVSFNFEQEATSSQHCVCIKADYECDFGYYRNNSDDCTLSPQFKDKELEYCENGREEDLRTWGYRQIPGDVCEGGYQPQRNVEELKAKCNGSRSKKTNSRATVIVLTLLLIVICAGVLFILYRKRKLPCIHTSSSGYKYSQLSQGDSLDSKAVDLNSSLQGYHDDSDEDMLE